MKKITALVLFVLGIVICPALSRAGEYPWQLKVNKEGIAVSTRKVEASPILEYKGSVVVDAPIEKVTALYEDEKQIPLWFYQCVDSQLVADEGAGTKVFYFVIHPPWPVAERDTVYRSVKSINAASGQVTYILSALPDRLPPHKGRVRVTYLKTVWHFTPLPDGKTEIDVQQHSDAGGSIPKFLVNEMAVDIPYNSLKNLRNMLLPEKGSNQKVNN